MENKMNAELSARLAKVEEMNIEELHARAAEIRKLVKDPNADLDALDAEASAINQRREIYDRE